MIKKRKMSTTVSSQAFGAKTHPNNWNQVIGGVVGIDGVDGDDRYLTCVYSMTVLTVFILK